MQTQSIKKNLTIDIRSQKASNSLVAIIKGDGQPHCHCLTVANNGRTKVFANVETTPNGLEELIEVPSLDYAKRFLLGVYA